MLRSAASKVMWVGRATVFLVGLAVILALVLGVATSAMGATGQNFILGKLNNAATSVTGLVGNVDGAAALRVTNPNSGTNDTALDLRVQAGEAPMRVNSATRVANLNAANAGRADSAASADTATNADKVDQLDSTALLPGGDLPRGRTVRGNYDIRDAAAPSSTGMDSSAISFGYRLTSRPIVRIIKANATAPAECPGTASSPEAAPGYLCVYELDSGNLYNSDYPNDMNVSGYGATLQAFSTPNGTSFAAPFFTYGTWAVTGN